MLRLRNSDLLLFDILQYVFPDYRFLIPPKVEIVMTEIEQLTSFMIVLDCLEQLQQLWVMLNNEY